MGLFYQIYMESYPRTLESTSASVWQRQISGKPAVCRTATTPIAYCVNWTLYRLQEDVKNNRKIEAEPNASSLHVKW